MQFDYEFFCRGLGNLTGLETRVFKNKQRVYRYGAHEFNPDITGLITRKIKDSEENAFYVETDELLVFGVIKSKEDKTAIIIGPTSQIRPGKHEAASVLYTLGEPYGRLDDLQSYFSGMALYPFEVFLEMLCFVNYALNEEKLPVSHLIKKSGQLTESPLSERKQEPETEAFKQYPNNMFQAEQLMLSYVTSGNTGAILSLFDSPPAGRGGLVANNELRQKKNTFVCAATLISRAAIAGGMEADTAFALSDRYIQKAELLSYGGDIAKLNMEMLLDYTKRVEAVKCGASGSAIAKSVVRYIQKNVEKKISVRGMAENLGLNRCYMCERFKADTGGTIGGFIARAKVEEAKRMLKTSKLTAANISDCLSFSSQSYFQTVFKKFAGCTPKEYRKSETADLEVGI
jgi:AraC-like DNA-binding protein